MASAPDITFRDSTTPSSVLGSLSYLQSSLGGDYLPVLKGYNSNMLRLRLYNNWALSAGLADAANISITVYDGAGVASHTATKSPVSQSWVHIYESGFGENSVTPGLLTFYGGSDTAIGGAPAGTNVYIPEKGSNGVPSPKVRAGTDTNGVGFIEFLSYVQVPSNAGGANWSFAVSVSYEWTS